MAVGAIPPLRLGHHAAYFTTFRDDLVVQSVEKIERSEGLRDGAGKWRVRIRTRWAGTDERARHDTARRESDRSPRTGCTSFIFNMLLAVLQHSCGVRLAWSKAFHSCESLTKGCTGSCTYFFAAPRGS